MAEMVMVIGKSGAGKSHALKNMDPNRTLVVNVCGKRLPITATRTIYRCLLTAMADAPTAGGTSSI